MAFDAAAVKSGSAASLHAGAHHHSCMDAEAATPRRWITIKYLSTCIHCHTLIQRGSPVFPGQARGYYHRHCAEQLHAEGQLDLTPPVCRHFSGRGYCLLGDACFFRHPADLHHGTGQATLPQASMPTVNIAAGQDHHVEEHHAETNARAPALALAPAHEAAAPVQAMSEPTPQLPAAKKVTNEMTRRQNRGAGRRNKVRNDWRASALRQWMIHTWGREQLCQGSGILDVGGGKGDLAFELLNLNGIPASLVDPRPLDMASAARRLRLGVYAQSVAFQDINQDVCAIQPDMLPTQKRNARPQHIDLTTNSKQAGAQHNTLSACSAPVVPHVPPGSDVCEQLPGEVSLARSPVTTAGIQESGLPAPMPVADVSTSHTSGVLLQPVQYEQSQEWPSYQREEHLPVQGIHDSIGQGKWQAHMQAQGQGQEETQAWGQEQGQGQGQGQAQGQEQVQAGQLHAKPSHLQQAAGLHEASAQACGDGPTSDTWLHGSPHRTPGQVRILLTYPIIQAAVQYQHALRQHFEATAQQQLIQQDRHYEEQQVLQERAQQHGNEQLQSEEREPHRQWSQQDQCATNRNSTTERAHILPICQVCGWPEGLASDAVISVRMEMRAAARMVWTRQGLSADAHEQPVAANPGRADVQEQPEAERDSKQAGVGEQPVCGSHVGQVEMEEQLPAGLSRQSESHDQPLASNDAAQAEVQVAMQDSARRSREQMPTESRGADNLWWHHHKFNTKAEQAPGEEDYEDPVQQCQTCGATWSPHTHYRLSQLGDINNTSNGSGNNTTNSHTNNHNGNSNNNNTDHSTHNIHNSNGSGSNGVGGTPGHYNDWQQELKVLHTLATCSAVVAMHADQATEPAVDLAIALGKPWAVVPCCVYSNQFLVCGRRLPDGTQVTTYEQLVAYLQHKQAGAKVQALPMEGKNLLVWSDAC